MITLFGWSFKRKEEAEPASFSPKTLDDGALVVAPGGNQVQFINLDGTVRTQAELVTRYREMVNFPACHQAVSEIVNESVPDEESVNIKIVLDDLNLPANVKKAMEECFQECVDLLDYRNNAYDIFYKWYVDGRLYFHAIIDPKNPADGIQELRWIDPRKIRKVREVIIRPFSNSGEVNSGDAVVQQTKDEYYLYSNKGYNTGYTFQGPAPTGLKIAKDAIVYITSGLTDSLQTMVLSYLHTAIKPLNQLSTLQDASVIYRLVRASERRIWYIDIGNLPRVKAEQYVRDIMAKHKNRLTYDAASGEIMDQRKFLTITEDYWLPRRSDGQGTKVESLPPGTGWSMDDVNFFKEQLYTSLHVPLGRLSPDDTYAIGMATEITREEVTFGKFITRLRNKFSGLFLELLKRQCVLKEIFTIEDFEAIASQIDFQFAKDNYFLEMKENQVLTSRAQLAMTMAPMIGRYFSNEWARKTIFRQSDDDIEENDEQIAIEMQNPQFAGMLGQPPPPEEEPEQQQTDGGFIVDPNAIPDPNQEDGGKSPPPSKNKKDSKSKDKGSKKQGFDTVASILSKKT